MKKIATICLVGILGCVFVINHSSSKSAEFMPPSSTKVVAEFMPPSIVATNYSTNA